ncbi:hypothetical protein J437_LFUL015477 [Ladona fulva]|uniref:tRNA-splicing endonuclease subunit Sen54 N-terminal domain-containing protein n=1 Tax=Ladona fulva TaxID=123851 RepID=A0A8K0KH84_LADFU|nr:hypothetical protein J437_LFUL015477 [Ladona fulva]
MASSSSNRRMGSEEDLPVKLKQFKPSDNRVEKKKIENLLNETRSILEEERLERLASLSQAEWIPSIQLVKVTKLVGRQWSYMGHRYLGDMVLYPEEALFLLETNAIEISYGGMPMSLQQAYSVLLGANSTCTLEEYRVYSHLTKYGYKLRRHGYELVNYRRENDEPPDIDVVGIICKRKSSENVSSEKTSGEENPARKAKEEIPHKWSCNLITSTQALKQNPPSVDDDDVKFIEFVDANKKRKVCDTIVIGDDVEILSCSANKESHSVNQGGESTNSNVNRCEGGSEIPKQETKCGSSDCLAKPNGENSPVEESVDSSNKPSRALYKREPFPTLKKDDEVCKCVPMSNNINKPTGKVSREGEVQNNIPSTTEVSKESSDDVVVILSDDESEGNDKHKREIEKFYKEISLLEVIDISQDDDEKKSTSSNRANDSRVVENYDFWGVLGRIPIMRNGKLSILVPTPPSDLIPSNIKPVQEEYNINVKGMSEKPVRESGDNLRFRDGHGKWKNFDRGGSHASTFKSNRFQGYHHHHHHHQRWQKFHHPWSSRNAHYPHANGFDPSLPSTSSQSHFDKQYPQSAWLSYVYTHRPSNKSFGHFHARNGNSYHSRGHSRSFSHGRDRDKPSGNAADEDDSYISVVPKNPCARNWSDMKRSEMKQEIVVTTDEVSTNAIESSPWSNPVQKISPLLEPSDSVDVDAVLSKIQVTTSAKLSCDTLAARTCSLSIKYDLYMPNSFFRKSCPGAPRYRLSVVKSNDSIPKLSDISHLMKNVTDEVPLLFAVGFPETINFFSFSNVDLPVLLKKLN